MDKLDGIIADAKSSFDSIRDLAALEQAKARFLGKSGTLTEMLKGLGKLSAEQRPQAGVLINKAKEQIEALLQSRREANESVSLEARLGEEALDVTLPGRGRGRGGIHPVIRTWQRIEAIFRSVGFDVADGPEIETDWHNFTALNQPENHPARSMHDTFYVEGGLLLRTHTSPMQVRYARTHKPTITRCVFGLPSFRSPSRPPKSTWLLPADRTRVAGWRFPVLDRCTRTSCANSGSTPSAIPDLRLAADWNA